MNIRLLHRKQLSYVWSVLALGKKRKIIQWITTLLYNANLTGFIKGNLYKGKLKGICVPGLNCYSCPGAIGTCPIGALQSSLSNLKRSFSYYMVGMLLLFGTVFGRFICGWACPIGLLQECIYKVPIMKSKRKYRFLKWLKYVVLIVFVIAIPIITMFKKRIGIPAFCKYICPSGTIAGISLIAVNETIRGSVALQFFIKLIILIVILMISIRLFRPFCRFLCPLGAIYSLCNSFALFRMEKDKEKCTDCKICDQICEMNANPSKNCNSMECIRCGKCISNCPSGALHFSFPVIKPKKADIMSER